MKEKIISYKPILLTLQFCVLFGLVSSISALSEAYIPSPGDWSGSTSQGKLVEFEVNETSTHIPFFQITYEKECGSIIILENWAFITIGGGDGTEIINNQFLISSSGRGFTGTFTSNVTSTGTFNINYYDEDLGEWCYAAGTWDTISGALSFKMFLPVLRGHSES